MTRRFPEPGPAKQLVEYAQSPVGTVEIKTTLAYIWSAFWEVSKNLISISFLAVDEHVSAFPTHNQIVKYSYQRGNYRPQ